MRFSNYIIVDLEAVPTKNGYFIPIEIGFCVPGFLPQSWLIKPPEHYEIDIDRVMNPVLLSEAKAEGLTIEEIFHISCSASHGRVVVSDALFFDKPLLQFIFRQCSADFNCQMDEFFVLIDSLACEKAISREQLNVWINEIDETRTVAHRAGPDAHVRASLLHRILTF